MKTCGYNLRFSKGLLLRSPNCKTLMTLGDRAFVAAVPKLWNALPKELRLIGSVSSFKRHLKSHFFRLFIFYIIR